MTSDPPEVWLGLSAHKRDILVTLDVDGPESGHGVWERVGEGFVSDPTTHRNLKALLNAGFVESEPKDGRENIYSITGAGRELVDVARGWME